MAWYVYMLRCADDTLYTGITTDVKRRLLEHNGGVKTKGAKYTSARRPVELVYQKRCRDRSKASQEEYKLRNLNRKQKSALLTK